LAGELLLLLVVLFVVDILGNLVLLGFDLGLFFATRSCWRSLRFAMRVFFSAGLVTVSSAATAVAIERAAITALRMKRFMV